jgi:hypothetical protein
MNIITNGTPRKNFIACWFRASFLGLYSFRLCLIISTLIYSHSDSRVPTYRDSTHFVDPLEDEKLIWTFFRPVVQKQLENFSPLWGIQLPTLRKPLGYTVDKV